MNMKSSSSSLYQNIKQTKLFNNANSNISNSNSNNNNNNTNNNKILNKDYVNFKKLQNALKSKKINSDFIKTTPQQQQQRQPKANQIDLSNKIIHHRPILDSPTQLSMNKLGPIFTVGYLGSAILTKGKTGLGCLQQPLRELYFMFRENGSRLIQERRFLVSLDGLTMLYNEMGVEKYLHNDLSSVYDVQLLKLVCEQRKDKKMYGAFLPVEYESDICHSNLFYPLDKQYIRCLQQQQHPHPHIIALIMRRSFGIQALECHVIITRSSSEARLIVNAIDTTCLKYKQNLNQQTKVFQYTPYNEADKRTHSYNLNHYNNHNHQSALNSSQIRSSPLKNSLLPPKSPFSHKIHQKSSSDHNNNSPIYNAYVDNSQVHKILLNDDGKINNKKASSKSTSSISSSSIFNKLKSNFMDGKSSKSKKSAKNSKALYSSSAVQFPSSHQLSSSNNSNRDESFENRRSMSAMANPIGNKPRSSSQGRNLNQPSVTSMGSCASGKSNSSGKEKKMSLGKRLLLSARSSLKSSNTSLNSKNFGSNRTLVSGSNTSINTLNTPNSQRKKTEDLADIDFRRSRCSVIDNNLLIDSNSLFNPIPVSNNRQTRRPASSLAYTSDHITARNRTQTPVNFVYNRDKNVYFKSRSPACMRKPSADSIFQSPFSNRLTQQMIYPRSLTPSSIKYCNASNYTSSPSLLTPYDNNGCNFESRKPPPSSYSNRSNSSYSVNRKYNNESISADTDDYETDYANIQDNNSSFNFSMKKIKLPAAPASSTVLMNDTKLLANHLVWNKNSKSAECIDEFNRAVSNVQKNPVARAISPGFALLPSSSSSNLGSSFNMTTSHHYSPATSRSHSYSTSSTVSSNIKNNEIKLGIEPRPYYPNEVIYSNTSSSPSVKSTAIGTGHGKIITSKDSAYNSTTSSQDTNIGKLMSFRSSAFSAMPPEQLRKQENANPDELILDRIKIRHEEEAEIRKQKLIQHHKIIGAVKVFPSLPHQYKQAAEERRNRLNAIEANLARLEKSDVVHSNQDQSLEHSKSHHRMLSTGFNISTTIEDSDNDHEIIDLTKKTKILSMRQEKSDNTSSQSIPIEIMTSKTHQQTNINGSFQQTTKLESNPLNNSNSSSNQADMESFSHVDKNQKTNYIYYFDNNQDFGGY